jgi:hypothetical protein
MILVVQQGADAGRQVRLERGLMSIGRGADCDVVLQETHASRRHAELRRQGDQWLILDVGSTNGTFVGDVRLQPNVPQVLQPNVPVTIGGTRFVLREEPRAAPAYAPAPAVAAGPQAQAGWAAGAAPDAGAGVATRASSAGREAAIWVCRMVVVAGCGLMSLGALRDWILVEVRAPLIGTTVFEQTYSGMDSGQGGLFLGAAAIAIVLMLVDIALPRSGLVAGLGQMLVGIIVSIVSAVNVYQYYQAGTREYLGISLLDVFGQYAGELIDINVQPGVYLLGIGLIVLILGGLSRLIVAVLAGQKR